MKITSFDSQNNRIKRDNNQDGLFNLFQKNIVFTKNIKLKIYLVPREFEMRLDKISNHIYGSPDYIEELMVLNDIINPYSVKEGQEILFCSLSDLGLLYTKDDLLVDEDKKKKLIESSQPNRDKKKLNNNQNLPPTVKPQGLEQIKIDKNAKKVKLINSFE
jgi:hypothetical protein